MQKERKLLRRQLELLAEQSEGALPEELTDLSAAMCKVYKSLVTERSILFVALSAVQSFDLTVYGVVQIVKLLGRET